MRKEPYPPIKLHLLFWASKSGPYKYSLPWTVKSKEYIDLVQAAFDSWEEDKQKAQGKVDSSVAQTAKQLCGHQQTKRKDQMTKAREKAAQAIAAKKRKQSIDLAGVS